LYHRDPGRDIRKNLRNSVNPGRKAAPPPVFGLVDVGVPGFAKTLCGLFRLLENGIIELQLYFRSFSDEP